MDKALVYLTILQSLVGHGGDHKHLYPAFHNCQILFASSILSCGLNSFSKLMPIPVRTEYIAILKKSRRRGRTIFNQSDVYFKKHTLLRINAVDIYYGEREILVMYTLEHQAWMSTRTLLRLLKAHISFVVIPTVSVNSWAVINQISAEQSLKRFWKKLI